MPVIVEDGTSKLDADSYVSLADFKAACGLIGYDLTGQADTVLEQKLRLATGYIDSNFRFKGIRATAEQSLEFPRQDLIDFSSYPITGVPKRVVKATVELAFKALSEDLFIDLDRGGKVQSQSVGPISVTYAADAPAGKTFRAAESLLKPYLRSEGSFMNPVFFSTSDAPSFETGQFDNPDIRQADPEA